jgi:hypothetical protein
MATKIKTKARTDPSRIYIWKIHDPPWEEEEDWEEVMRAAAGVSSAQDPFSGAHLVIF